MEMNDNFYDKDKGEFNTGEDMKIAKILGDDIDNPKYTFRIIESITDKRIETLSDIDNIFDNIEQELYYRIKTLFEDFDKQSNNLNSQNLLLQKYLTQLTKDKMDLLVQINLCMQRLDSLEKFLGISIANKRMKKTFNK